MPPLFVGEPLQFLEIKSDELGNPYALRPNGDWVLITNKPEEVVRIYLLNLFDIHFTHISFEGENAVRSDISCYMKHPDTLLRFTYRLRPFAIWETKRIDGPNFSNTLRQINGYIQANKLMFGAFFYNCLEMGYVDWDGNTRQINSIDELGEILNGFIADCTNALNPIYQSYKKALDSEPNNIFDNIIDLINRLNDANLKYLFKGKTTFHILVDEEEYTLSNLEYDIERDCLIKYTSPDNFEFYREQQYTLIGVS